MVTFEIENKTADKVIYKYYPENKRERRYGILSLYLRQHRVEIDLVAEDDFLRIATAEELNDFRDILNKMRIENGESPLSEEELPIATEDEEWYYYADQAAKRVLKEVKNGTIPERGTVKWY